MALAEKTVLDLNVFETNNKNYKRIRGERKVPLNQKEETLLKLLINQQDWLSAAYLAKALAVSTRTVRNYVAKINQHAESDIIIASRKGYKMDTVVDLQGALYSLQPELNTPKERSHYLMNLLIQNRRIDYFDVAETLFVSIPTIEKDTLHLRKKLSKYQLKIIKNGHFLSIEGEETNFRKLASDLLQDEVGQNFQSIHSIQTIFPDIPIETIQNIVVDKLSKQQLYVNGYAMNSLLLHLAIAVNRLVHHQRSDIDQTPEIFSETQIEYQIASQIGKQIHKALAVEMDLYEINSLALLLMTKISPSNDTSLKNYIETSIYTFVAEVLETVAEKYFITQMSEELVLNLSLHVSNLIYRAKNGKQVRNPLSEEIKHSYAFIYEVAVFIAQKIQQKIKLPISDDEITFIAMHIGSYFEEKFETENKLSCVIYTPEYYDMHERLVYKIDEKFNSQLNIVDTFYRLDSNALVKMRQADLVLSTIEIKELDKAIQLSPFLSGKDLEKIQAEIQTVQQRKVLNTLKKSIQTYLTPEHFKRNIYLDSPDDYIDYLGTQLVQTDYIEPSFIDLIKAREKMSATSFNNAVALPHAMEMTAKKTGISIILNDYPVKWGTYYVQVIIIIVMNKTDMKKFRQLFDFMIDTFSEQEKLHQLLSTQNYTAFIDTLFE